MILAKQFYNDFPKATFLFVKEPRAFCYELSQELIDRARRDSIDNWYRDNNTVKAILLLLFCWNFAARITKQLKIQDVVEILDKHRANLRSLEHFSIMDKWESESNKIKAIYTDFKKTFGQTGASKALSLLNPRLFVMWDTKIREFLGNKRADKRLRINELGNGEEPESYLMFLKGIKNIIKELDLHERLENQNDIAKKIDEYHYVKLVM